MRVLRFLLILLVIAAIGGGAFLWLSRKPEIAVVETASRSSFSAAEIAAGEKLAAVADCAVCHTRQGGPTLAGGLALPTPFGTIYSTNITPDRETGIGTWSEAALRRALREGVDREGNHLYPAFPYDHFTRVTDADVRALYAYLMTQPAQRSPALANGLPFPFNIRPLMAGWNLLFLDNRRFAPDPAKSAEWNRGAYLVEGLGHCGACHTPRNLFGATKQSARFGGGEAEGWHAPALAASSRAPIAWTKDAILNYLIDGWDAEHGVAGGPMTPVVNQLAKLAESDIDAIATYLIDIAGPAPAGRAEAAKAFAAEREFKSAGVGAPPQASAGTTPSSRGEATFARACANCHRQGGQTVPMALLTSVNNPGPTNVIQAVLVGVKPPDGSPDRSMPGFAGSLTDSQIAELVEFIRSRFSKDAAWTEVEKQVASARSAAAH